MAQMLLATGEVCSKHPGTPPFLGSEGERPLGVGSCVPPVNSPLPLQLQQSYSLWPYACEQAAAALPVSNSACRPPAGSQIQPVGTPLTTPLQLQVGSGTPSCLGVEGRRLAAPAVNAAVESSATPGGPSSGLWVSGGAACNGGPVTTSCPSPCSTVASYSSCHVSCLGKPLQHAPVSCFQTVLMGSPLGSSGHVVQHARSTHQQHLLAQQPCQQNVLLQQHLVQQHLVHTPIMQQQVPQQPGGGLSLCIRPEISSTITTALRSYLSTVVSEVYKEVRGSWGSSKGCCAQLQHLPVCRKDREGGSSPIGTSSTATTSGGLEEEEDSAFCSSGSNGSNISATTSSTSKCRDTVHAPVGLPKGLSSDDAQSALQSGAASSSGADDGITEGKWSLLCKPEGYSGSNSSAAQRTRTAGAAGEEAFHLDAIKNCPPHQLAKYLTLLLPFLSESPRELRAINPRCFQETRTQLETLYQRFQEQRHLLQIPSQQQPHQHQLPVQHQHVHLRQQHPHQPIRLQQQQQPMALQQPPHHQPIALQQHHQPELRLHPTQQISLQHQQQSMQQPKQDASVEQPQQLAMPQQQLPTLLQQQQQLAHATGLSTAQTGFAAGCCSALREAAATPSPATGTTATAASGFSNPDGQYGGAVVAQSWQGTDAAAAPAPDGVRGQGRGRSSWPVDDSLRWGPPASPGCSVGTPYGYIGTAPAAASGKRDCQGNCSASSGDPSAMVQLPRAVLQPSVPAPAAQATETPSGPGDDCVVPKICIGTLSPCAQDGFSFPGRMVMPWGSRGSLGRPSPPSVGTLATMESAAAASPQCLWPISSSTATTAAHSSTTATPPGTAPTSTTTTILPPMRKKLIPAELGSVISAEGLGRSPRGNVRVCHSPPHNAWLVLCCAGGVESRAFSVLQLGYEGAKRVALLYAAQCRRHLNSRRSAAAKTSTSVGSAPDGAPDRPSKVRNLEELSPGVAASGLGSTGPPGGPFNLIDCSGDVPYTTRSDVSASRVARLSRRAMELPYVHGVRFEAETFAWVAQMRGEARRFLVKKHGFIKSRLCAVEKIQAWRATLPQATLEHELKVEQEVLEMLRSSAAHSAPVEPVPVEPNLQQLDAPDFRETSGTLDF